jgi:hypothetical protein
MARLTLIQNMEDGLNKQCSGNQNGLRADGKQNEATIQKLAFHFFKSDAFALDGTKASQILGGQMPISPGVVVRSFLQTKTLIDRREHGARSRWSLRWHD